MWECRRAWASGLKKDVAPTVLGVFFFPVSTNMPRLQRWEKAFWLTSARIGSDMGGGVFEADQGEKKLQSPSSQAPEKLQAPSSKRTRWRTVFTSRQLAEFVSSPNPCLSVSIRGRIFPSLRGFWRLREGFCNLQQGVTRWAIEI